MRLLVVLLTLSAPAAFAQSEDEQIMQADPAPAQQQPAQQQPAQPTPPPEEPPQHREDAKIDDEELDDQVFYSGLGIERVSTDFDNLGEATNLAAVLGFRVPTFPWVGLEIDLGQTLIPGDYRDPRPAQPAMPLGCGGPLTPPCTTPAQPAEEGAEDAAGDELAMQALGLSLAFKTRGRFYFTGRYGYRYLATSNDTLNENRSGNGFGVGVGYRWGKGLSGVEVAYKQIAEDVDSIGLVFFVRSARR
jgi:hypothetical protein